MSGTDLEKETLLPRIRNGQTDGKTKIIQMLELAGRGFRVHHKKCCNEKI